jgi:phosphohistidine phosphatase SixA
MKKIFFIIVLIFTYSCKTQFVEQEKTYIPKEEQEDVVVKKMPVNAKTTFYLIRHAESNGNRATNPHLIKKGIKRAHLYAQFFANKKVDTIFTTNLNRTYDTAEIIAKARDIPIVFYDPYKMDYQQFFKQHKNSHSLVVGHSNTTPNFTNGLLGEPKYSQMVEENYSDMFFVSVDGNNTIHDKVFVLEEEIQKMEDAKLSPKELKKVLKARRKAANNK